jgi:hypothetical protein
MCKTYKYWTEREEKILFDHNYGGLNMKQRHQLATNMGRTLDSLQNRWAAIKNRKKPIAKPIRLIPVEPPKPIVVNSKVIDAILAKATSASVELDTNRVIFHF